MKASELISLLEAGIRMHGDLDMYKKHVNNVFGKMKDLKVAYRSKRDPIRQFSGFNDDDKGDKVFKI